LGDPAFGQGNPATGPHREGKPIADDERTREVGPSSSSCEAGEQGGAIRRGAGGAKGWDQGECEPAAHGPDAEPGNRVTGAGAHTSNCKNSDLPSLTRGRSRMRESRTYGSVRGAGSNLRPYRDRLWHCSKSAAIKGIPDVLPTSSPMQPFTTPDRTREAPVGSATRSSPAAYDAIKRRDFAGGRK